MSFDSLFGLRDRVAPNLDRAVATVTNGDERFLWEISFPLLPQMSTAVLPGMPPQMTVTMTDWLVLTCPSPILGEGTIVSATKTDLRALADDENQALDVVRQLATNLRDAVAQKIALDNPPPLPGQR